MESDIELWVLAPTTGGRVPALPPLRFPLDPGQRVLPPARRAIATYLGVDRPVLEVFIPDGQPEDGPLPVLIVLEPGAQAGARATGPELDPATLPAPLQARATTWLREIHGDAPIAPSRAAWARPGWFEETRDWLDAQLARVGRRRTGPLEAQRTWGLSWVARAETAAGAIWVKASCPVFHAEPAVTRWLADRFPDAIPQVVAADPERTLLTMEAMPGGTLRERGEPTAAPRAIARMAALQHDALTSIGDLQALDLPVRPLTALAPDLARCWDRPDPVADLPLPPGRLVQLVDWVADATSALLALGLPDTLVHGDFHAGNVGADGPHLRIFDWSDAAIAHPLMDAAPWGDDPAHADARWAAWVRAWADRADPERLAQAQARAIGAGAAYQLVSLDAILRGMEPAVRHLLADSAQAYATILDRAAHEEGDDGRPGRPRAGGPQGSPP